MASTRKYLTLEERVKCIKLLESGKSSRVVASEFGVGRTQIQNVLKRKREILGEYESNGRLSAKRPKRDMEYGDLNDLVLKWLLDATARLVNVSGPMIQEKARKFAKDLGHTDFKGSNGWLDCFLKRNNIVFKTQSGERGEVKNDTVKQWKETTPGVCKGYAPKDIFNMDESGLFFRDTTKSTYYTKGETCTGGKRSKHRITIALCVSMTGEKLKPLVIGKSRRPRCFGRMSTDALPVRYEANNKAWMLTPLMEDWLKNLDRKMCAQNRKILLLLYNAPVHPNIKFENVKLQFFPANTTSALQPMDAGIIQAVKLKYRKRQLQHVLSEMERHPSKLGPEILRDINVLQAIYWINSSWQEVAPDTIQKCFAKCGFTDSSVSGFVNSDSEPSESVVSDSDPVFELEDNYPLAVLKLSSELFGYQFKELLEIDNLFSTCDNNLQDWDKSANEILKDLNTCATQECDSDQEEQDDNQSTTAITASDVAQYIEKIKQYALGKNQPILLNKIMELDDCFIQQRVEVSEIQTKIYEFFKKG